jgi:hypothetical protein
MLTKAEIEAELKSMIKAVLPEEFELFDKKDLAAKLESVALSFATDFMGTVADADRIQIVMNEDPSLIAAGRIELTLTFPAVFNCQKCRHSAWSYEDPQTDLLLGCLERPEVLLQAEDKDAMVWTAFHCPWRSPIAGIEEK